MRKMPPIEVAAKIDRRKYIQVPGHNALISKFEPEQFKGYDWDGTHIQVGEKRLQMAPPSLFAPHFINVVRAYREETILHDGLGRLVPRKEVEDIYKHLTSGHIYGGAWSHLDAKFRFY